MKTLVENNRLIAEFMGYEVIQYKGQPTYNSNPCARTIGEQRALWNGLDLEFTGRFVEQVSYPFDTDFNYLLPVIRRIEEQGYVVCIAGIRYQVYKVMDEGNPIVSRVCGDVSKKTEMVYHLVVAFIESLNQESN